MSRDSPALQLLAVVVLVIGLGSRAALADPSVASAQGSSSPALDKDSASSDCPPGFPGCRDSSASPESCRTDDDCSNGQVCKDGRFCEDAKEAPPAQVPYKRQWITVGFQAEALLLPTAQNACAGGTGYTCFAGDRYYSALPLAGADDLVNGGVRLATARVLVGYDLAVAENVTLGARLGYAFGGGPRRPASQSFEPIHVEGRASYWFGHDPLGRLGLRFFLDLAAGMAEVDASIPVDVYASQQAYQAGQSQNYVAWKKTGLGFAAFGPGLMYALTPDSGIILEAKAMQMFPTAGTGAALQLGYTIGL
jgi:Cys-rich repeat protein